jgi:hypothetical protein
MQLLNSFARVSSSQCNFRVHISSVSGVLGKRLNLEWQLTAGWYVREKTTRIYDDYMDR